MKVLSIILFLLLPGAASGHEQRINSVYYTVTGDSVEDLRADLLTKTPVEHNGKKYAAFTRWQVNWQFRWRDDGSSCDITSVETSLDVTYTLPRLERAARTPEAVVERWEAYYAALFDHEQGHKDLGAQAAVQIKNDILRMGPRTTCAELEADANAIARKVVETYSRLEKEYDRSTNHGLNTGAVFF